MLSTTETIVRATGTGRNELDAFQAAVRDMRTKIMNDYDEAAILQMEPTNCRVLHAVEHTRTEKFFGVLFPRTVSTFEIALEFTICLKTVDIPSVHFTQSAEQLSPAQHLLQMR